MRVELFMTVVMNSGSSGKTEYQAQVEVEQTVGGGLAPCPICGVPRSQRTSYIRCSKCGINWDATDDLGRHPSRSGKA